MAIEKMPEIKNDVYPKNGEGGLLAVVNTTIGPMAINGIELREGAGKRPYLKFPEKSGLPEGYAGQRALVSPASEEALSALTEAAVRDYRAQLAKEREFSVALALAGPEAHGRRLADAEVLVGGLAAVSGFSVVEGKDGRPDVKFPARWRTEADGSRTFLSPPVTSARDGFRRELAGEILRQYGAALAERAERGRGAAYAKGGGRGEAQAPEASKEGKEATPMEKDPFDPGRAFGKGGMSEKDDGRDGPEAAPPMDAGPVGLIRSKERDIRAEEYAKAGKGKDLTALQEIGR